MATKTGTAGGDFLYGGGPDTLVGLQGDDTYVVYSGADNIVENGGEGRDTVLSFGNYTLAAAASIETLSTATNADTATISLTGNALSQILVGNYGTNTLDGAGGGDALAGLRGDDVYRVYGRTDLVVENAGEGFDRILTSGDFVLGAGSAVEVIGTADAAATTALFIGGNELSQSINGNAGNNLINSGGGADTLDGGLGDDTYRVFGNGEVVNESSGAGLDTIFTSGSLVLQGMSAVEYVSAAVQGGTEAINIAGSGTAQTIVGNYGNNILDGRSGGDTLIGLRGDDTYRVYSSADFVVENAAEGNDTLFTSGTYVLRQGASVETLSTDQNNASTGINIVGNELGQVVIGNFGVNLLDGGAGTDVLYGLAGADVFRFSSALGAGNIDTLADFGSDADSIQLDPTVFTGLANGPLAASAIAYGAAAADADDRVIYNPQTGALSFDTDGTGSTAAVQFAVLPTGLAASAISVNVAATTNAGPVRITTGGTFLLGGATGNGVSLETTYPEATSFIFGSPQAFQSQPANLVFGPSSYAAGRPPISFTEGQAIGSFDFAQLGTGVSVRPTTEFQTTGGAFIIAQSRFNEADSFARPTSVTGSPFDDYIDLSLRSDVTGPSSPSIRQGGDIFAGAGNDVLIGGRAMDGGLGDDILVGRLASRLTGGAGVDTFQVPINTRTPGTSSGASPNVLVDYAPSTDRIALVLNIASDLSPGALDASRFVIGAEATTADQRIIYNPATGTLKYDFNGSGADPSSAGGLLGIFAQLPANLELSAANFTVTGVELTLGCSGASLRWRPTSAATASTCVCARSWAAPRQTQSRACGSPGREERLGYN